MERLHGYYFEDLEEGMAEVYGKTITDADIILFSGISGDINPLHLNHDFARETPFQGRIAHGMLTASFISTVIGTKLPRHGHGRSGDHGTAAGQMSRRPGNHVRGR
jgi:3-hydroxybutyryl-CoA dehydratase